MLGIFKRKAKQARNEAKKLENRDFLEAVLGGSVYVIASNGNVDDKQLATLDALIKTNPAFDNFGGEITEILNRFKTQFEISFRVGKTAALREIADIQCEHEQKEDLMNIILSVAEGDDGEIDEHEEEALGVIASALGLRIEDFR